MDDIKKNRIKTYSILTIPLDVALNALEVIFSGTYIYVLSVPAGLSTCQLQFNEVTNDKVDLLTQRAIQTPFYKLYVTTSALAGGVLKLAVGVLAESFDIKDFGKDVSIQQPSTPIVKNTVCTNANTEYNVAPAGSGVAYKKLTVRPRGGALKLCFTTGETAIKYIGLLDGQTFSEDNINSSSIVYFESPTAGCVVESLAWI
jgi:hypothetical protein